MAVGGTFDGGLDFALQKNLQITSITLHGPLIHAQTPEIHCSDLAGCDPSTDSGLGNLGGLVADARGVEQGVPSHRLPLRHLQRQTLPTPRFKLPHSNRGNTTSCHELRKCAQNMLLRWEMLTLRTLFSHAKSFCKLRDIRTALPGARRNPRRRALSSCSPRICLAP